MLRDATWYTALRGNLPSSHIDRWQQCSVRSDRFAHPAQCRRCTLRSDQIRNAANGIIVGLRRKAPKWSMNIELGLACGGQGKKRKKRVFQNLCLFLMKVTGMRWWPLAMAKVELTILNSPFLVSFFKRVQFFFVCVVPCFDEKKVNPLCFEFFFFFFLNVESCPLPIQNKAKEPMRSPCCSRIVPIFYFHLIVAKGFFITKGGGVWVIARGFCRKDAMLFAFPRIIFLKLFLIFYYY